VVNPHVQIRTKETLPNWILVFADKWGHFWSSRALASSSKPQMNWNDVKLRKNGISIVCHVIWELFGIAQSSELWLTAATQQHMSLVLNNIKTECGG
jgi:hypothetical protein